MYPWSWNSYFNHLSSPEFLNNEFYINYPRSLSNPLTSLQVEGNEEMRPKFLIITIWTASPQYFSLTEQEAPPTQVPGNIAGLWPGAHSSLPLPRDPMHTRALPKEAIQKPKSLQLIKVAPDAQPTGSYQFQRWNSGFLPASLQNTRPAHPSRIRNTFVCTLPGDILFPPPALKF